MSTRELVDTIFGADAGQLKMGLTGRLLTGHAMEQNMEAGLLISGGHIPQTLEEHLRALVSMRIVAPA